MPQLQTPNSDGHKRLLDLAFKSSDELEPLILDSIFERSDPGRMAAGLTLSILELHIGVNTMLESYSQSHAPVLLRTMLESLVSLKLLCKDPLYLNQIHHDDALQIATTLQDFQNSIEPPDEDYAERAGNIEEQKRIVKTHTDAGIGYLSFFKKAKNADMSEMMGAYSFLCTFTHNNATNIYARHGVGGVIDFASELPLDNFKLVLRLNLNFLIMAIELLPHYSNANSEVIQATIAAAVESLDVLE